jgi:hypothetical protein
MEYIKVITKGNDWFIIMFTIWFVSDKLPGVLPWWLILISICTSIAHLLFFSLRHEWP